jgi:chromosome partitioning protein
VSQPPRIVAIAARKGGVGKTAISVGLAHRLVARGQRVALVDLDPQSNVAAMLSGDPVAPGTAELLARQTIEPQRLHGIQVYAGGPSLDDPGLVMRLDPNDLSIALARLQVDVVLCDCPPGHQHLERLALRAAQVSLVPFEPHPVAVIGVQRVLEAIVADRELGRPAPAKVAVVISRFDPRQKRLHGNADKMLDFWSGALLTLRWDSTFAQALAIGEPPPNGRAVDDLEAMLRWMEAP